MLSLFFSLRVVEFARSFLRAGFSKRGLREAARRCWTRSLGNYHFLNFVFFSFLIIFWNNESELLLSFFFSFVVLQFQWNLSRYRFNFIYFVWDVLVLHESENLRFSLNLETCYLNIVFPIFSLFSPSGTPISCLSFPRCSPYLVMFCIFCLFAHFVQFHHMYLPVHDSFSRSVWETA